MKIALRELFLVVLIVALSLCWWLDRSKLAAKTEQMENLAHEASELAGIFGWILNSDVNYAVSFENGVSAGPVNGHNGCSHARAGKFAGIERIQRMVESEGIPRY